VNPFHFIKALFLALSPSVGPKGSSKTKGAVPSRMPLHWSPFLIVFVVLALGLGAWQFTRVMGGGPPSDVRKKLKIQSRKSPALFHKSKNLPSWNQFLQLVEVTMSEAKKSERPFGSVRLFQLQENYQDGVIWFTQDFTNQGFDPMSDFEHGSNCPAKDVMGFYDMDGKPLKFTTRMDQTREDRCLVTVHFNEPLARGATKRLVRLEQRHDLVRSPEEDVYQLSLMFPYDNQSVNARAIRLPPRSILKSYNPEEGTWVLRDQQTLIAWISSRISLQDAHPTVSFTKP
jgi:hypothetical protein